MTHTVRICEDSPASIKILALSFSDEGSYAQSARALGASGDWVTHILATAIREIFQGRTYFNPIHQFPRNTHEFHHRPAR